MQPDDTILALGPHHRLHVFVQNLPSGTDFDLPTLYRLFVNTCSFSDSEVDAIQSATVGQSDNATCTAMRKQQLTVLNLKRVFYKMQTLKRNADAHCSALLSDSQTDRMMKPDTDYPIIMSP